MTIEETIRDDRERAENSLRDQAKKNAQGIILTHGIDAGIGIIAKMIAEMNEAALEGAIRAAFEAGQLYNMTTMAGGRHQ